MNEIYTTTNQNNNVTRNSSLKLFQTLKTKALRQKCLSYSGPYIWNGLPDDVKLSNYVNTFNDKVKKPFDIIKRQRSRYVCILWVNYHHYHLILIMEL